jgi:hypothetical protein
LYRHRDRHVERERKRERTKEIHTESVEIRDSSSRVRERE